MPNSKEIQELQNKEENLIIQAAAGHYYNIAEYLNYACWILCIISIVVSFTDGDVSIVALCIIDAIATLCGYLLSFYTKRAADMRLLFDSRVIIGSDNNISLHERRNLIETAIKYSKLFKNQCKQQISNSGSDNPPGKKDWYTFNTVCGFPKAQIVCFEQNNLFKKKIMKLGYLVVAVLHFLACGIITLIVLYSGLSITAAVVINAIYIFIMRYGERVYQHWKYHNVSLQSETMIGFVREQPTEEGILKCLQFLNEYRHIPVFGSSLIHRFTVKDIESVYRKVLESEKE